MDLQVLGAVVVVVVLERAECQDCALIGSYEYGHSRPVLLMAGASEGLRCQHVVSIARGRMHLFQVCEYAASSLLWVRWCTTKKSIIIIIIIIIIITNICVCSFCFFVLPIWLAAKKTNSSCDSSRARFCMGEREAKRVVVVVAAVVWWQQNNN